MLPRTDTVKTQASRYRHYVNFQAKAQTSDNEGGFTNAWANISGGENIPVEILPMKAIDRAEMRSRNIIATHYIKSRSNIPIAETGRVVFSTPAGDRYFYIKSLEDIQTLGIEQFMIAEERRP